MRRRPEQRIMRLGGGKRPSDGFKEVYLLEKVVDTVHPFECESIVSSLYPNFFTRYCTICFVCSAQSCHQSHQTYRIITDIPFTRGFALATSISRLKAHTSCPIGMNPCQESLLRVGKRWHSCARADRALAAQEAYQRTTHPQEALSRQAGHVALEYREIPVPGMLPHPSYQEMESRSSIHSSWI